MIFRARKRFEEGDLSAKLELMGVDVASSGDYNANGGTAKPLVYRDLFSGVYKKLVLSSDGRRLMSGILVGDASEYGSLVAQSKCAEPLPVEPGAWVVRDGGCVPLVTSILQAELDEVLATETHRVGLCTAAGVDASCAASSLES